VNKKIGIWTAKLLIMLIVATSLTGCRNGSTGTDATVNDTEMTTETTADTKNYDFSYLYGYPTAITFYADVDVEKVDNGNNDAPYSSYDLKITDNGRGYLLQIKSIKYKLAIKSVDYRTFIDKAIGSESGLNDIGYHEYSLTDNKTLKFLGETFTLTSYSLDDMGRGHCKFIGEDNQTYSIDNDISSLTDEFTGMMYFEIKPSLVSSTKEVNLDDAVLFIPYETTLEDTFKSYVNGSPDCDSGNPGGIYSIQFDNEGNIMKIEG
jgi:hypothetical protein